MRTQHIEHFAFIIESPPQEHSLFTDLHYHLIRVPVGIGRRSGLSKIVGKHSAELSRPPANSLIADIDATLSHVIFNIAKTQHQPKIRPNCLTDSVARKPMASIGHRFHPSLCPIEYGTSKPQIANLPMAQVIGDR